MHHRILVDSGTRLSGTPTDFEFDVSDYTTLNEFAGLTVNFGLEWISTVAASDTQPDFADDTSHPLALLLECTSIPLLNSWASWRGGPCAAIALLPAYRQTGYYGVGADLPYLQTTSLSGLTRGDDIARRGTLGFRLLAAGDSPPAPLAAQFAGDYKFSLVFWVADPERPLTPYDFYSLWVSSANRASGTPQDLAVPVDLTTFAMEGLGSSAAEGRWFLGVSFVSPVGVDRDPALLPEGLELCCREFRDPRSHRSDTIAFLNRSHAVGEEPFFGRRLSTKPITSDTIGHPLRSPVDHLAQLNLQLREPGAAGPIEGGVTEWAACITFYRLT